MAVNAGIGTGIDPAADPSGSDDAARPRRDRELRRRAGMQYAASLAVRQAWTYGQTAVATLATAGNRFGGLAGGAGNVGSGTTGGWLTGGSGDAWADPFATPASLGLPPLEAEGDLEALRRLRDLTSDADVFGGA